jgi:hypothetical protein
MPRRDLSPEDIALARDMYARRYGVGSIATKFQISFERARELVQGVEVTPGPRRRAESDLWEREAARKLANEGKTVAFIARELQRPQQTVRHWVRPGAEEVRAAYAETLTELAEKKKRAIELFDLGIYTVNRVSAKVGSNWSTVEKWLKDSGRIS